LFYYNTELNPLSLVSTLYSEPQSALTVVDKKRTKAAKQHQFR